MSNSFVPFLPGNVARDTGFLLLICFAGFGIYFVYDLPAAVGVDFKKATNMTNQEFMFTFYSLYSFPSAISAIFSGFLIDNVFGLGLGGIVFAMIAVVSQLLILVGLLWDSPLFMGLGRFLHGAASEPLGVVRSTYNAKYFTDALYYGLVLAASRCGSVGGFLLTPQVLCYFTPNAPTCLEGMDNKPEPATPKELNFGLEMCVIVGTLTVVLATIMMGALSRIDAYFTRQDAAMRKRKAPKAQMKMSDIATIPLATWLLILVFMFFYSAVFPFNSMLPDYFKQHLGFDKESASTLSSVVYGFSVIGAPLFGRVIDMTKRHPVWAILGSGLLGVSQCGWGFIVLATEDENKQGLYWTIFALMTVNSICYSIIASCIMPWLGKMMKTSLKATAFGLLFGIQQIGVGSISSLLGNFVDQHGWDYFPQVCGGVSFIACALCIVILFIEGVNPWDTYIHDEDLDNEVGVEDVTVSRLSRLSVQ